MNNYEVANLIYNYRGVRFQISTLVELLNPQDRVRKYTIFMNDQELATIFKLEDTLLITLPYFLYRNMQQMEFVITLISDTLTIDNTQVGTFRREMALAIQGRVDVESAFVIETHMEEDGCNILIDDDSDRIKSVFDNF